MVVALLPITGANMEPLIAVASLCLLAGSTALVAGRARRTVGAPGRPRHRRR